MSEQDPFCYQLKNARDHIQHAITLCNTALAMPACKAWDRKHQRLLKSTRTQLSRQRTVLDSLVPAAVDHSSYKTPLICDEEDRAEVHSPTSPDEPSTTDPASDSQPG